MWQISEDVTTGLEVVHRDIKPANLFVCDTGPVKVTDLRIAKAGGAPGSAPPGP